MEPFVMMLLFIGYQVLKMLAANADAIERTVRLTWDTVYGWLTSRKTTADDVGRLIQQQMDNVMSLGGVGGGEGVSIMSPEFGILFPTRI